MPSEYEWADLLRLFQIPHQPIYVLGCFARHVTVYSQQVRALNLVSALRRNRVLESGQKVIVIGGGAAGLMAAAAIAYSGARVRVLDQFDGPMELQRNNRQRWLHPYIYDWPFTDRVGLEAQLPLLTWRAGYASDVAEQILQQWKRLEAQLRDDKAVASIHSSWSAGNIGVEQDANGVEVSWTDEKNANRAESASLLVMAVGFGLELDDETHDSYWAEDQLDGSFRTPAVPKQWFVSGAGDGGLTDVMRLCIRRFRHHEVAEIFSGIDGIEELKKSLKEIHMDDDLKPDPKRVHRRFCELLDLRRLPEEEPTPQPWGTLTKEFEKRAILRSGPPIMLASTTSHIYGPESSILNRLIVSQLDKLGRVTVLPNRTEKVDYSNGKYTVKLKNRKPFTVDYAILRHGPQSALEEGFPKIWDDSAPLRTMWEGRGMNRDNTRLRLWDPGEFGPETSTSLNSVSKNPNGPSVRAGRLLISKELREDGSSHIKYEIQGLSVSRGALRGMRCSIRATTGSVGEPVLDEDSSRLGMSWEEERNDGMFNVEGARDWVRQISRILHFGTPLEAGHTPLNVGFSVSLLNGDALSSWEFDQMYRTGERDHVNGDDLAGSEFLARFVWFPIDELVIRITLPTAITSIPSLNVFSCPPKLQEADVVHDGILQIMPLRDSPLHPTKTKWPRSNEVVLRDAKYLQNPSPRTWELMVPRPLVGSCYSIDWALPERTPHESFMRLISEAEKFRKRCLQHGDARRRGEDGDVEVRSGFVKLAASLEKLYRLVETADEAFEVSLMTYDDESKHELLTYEGMVSNEDRMTERLGRIKLPFGLGLAGTAFKECDKVHMFKRPAEPGAARSSRYVPLENSESHEVLLSVPFEHPAVLSLPPDGEIWDEVDRPRTCLGILNLGSDKPNSPLKSLTPSEILRLRDLCQGFAATFFSTDPPSDGVVI